MMVCGITSVFDFSKDKFKTFYKVCVCVCVEREGDGDEWYMPWHT